MEQQQPQYYFLAISAEPFTTAAVSNTAEVVRQAPEAAQPTYHASPEGRYVAVVGVWTARADSSDAAVAVGRRI